MWAAHDVTDRVEGVLPADADGVATVFVRHTTAGVVVNEPESGLLGDVESFLSELVPDEGWSHDRIDDNADAHLRAMLLGESVTVPVRDGELALGTWQAVLLVECDGPRSRTVDVVVH
ncbi:MAG: secondary thiamine-phosphate synthase enzyme YjbQ [Haloferacaceae archaeon]